MLNGNEMKNFEGCFLYYVKNDLLEAIAYMGEVPVVSIVKTVIGYMMEDGFFDYRPTANIDEDSPEVKVASTLLNEMVKNNKGCLYSEKPSMSVMGLNMNSTASKAEGKLIFTLVPMLSAVFCLATK